MSLLEYNAITLPYCVTKEFRQEAVYDDFSSPAVVGGGTDYIGTKFQISVESLLSLDYLDAMVNNDALKGAPITDAVRNRDIAGIVNALTTRLLAPRRRLKFKVNNVDMIPEVYGAGVIAGAAPPITMEDGAGAMISPSNNSVDSMHGPRPVSCVITNLSGVSFRVDYTINAFYFVNRRASNVHNIIETPVLYHRWAESVHIADDLMTTRTRQGKYILRTDALNPDRTPDTLRNSLTTFAIPPNFLRQSADIKLSADGMGIEYTLVDQQVYLLPPIPAIKAEGSFTVTFSKTGSERHGSASVTLTGTKYTHRTSLAVRASEVALQLMNRTSVNILEEMSFSRDMYSSNSVTVRARCRLAPLTPLSPVHIAAIAATAGLGIAAYFATSHAAGLIPFSATPFSEFYGPLPTNPPTPYTPSWPTGGSSTTFERRYARGTAGIILEAAAYWDPSLTGGDTGAVPGAIGAAGEGFGF